MLNPVKPAGFLENMPVSYGFFTRAGGVSEGLYAGLNCGPGSGDEPAAVTENRRRVAEYLDADTLNTIYQTHSNICIALDAPVGADKPEGDALVTDVPGLAIGVLTADCAPILYYGEKPGGAPVIGAAHAGWGGAFLGVQAAAVNAMVQKGAGIDTIHACIGPCIAQKSYEVGEEFAEKFLKSDEVNEKFFMNGQGGKLLFDLAGYNALRLGRAGVETICISGEDTYTDEARFYSYRRATHRNEKAYGRQISAIMID